MGIELDSGDVGDLVMGALGREIAAARGREERGGEGDRLLGVSTAGCDAEMTRGGDGGRGASSRALRRVSKRILVEVVRLAALTGFLSSA